MKKIPIIAVSVIVVSLGVMIAAQQGYLGWEQSVKDGNLIKKGSGSPTLSALVAEVK